MGEETGDDVKRRFKVKYKSDDVQWYFLFSRAPVNLMSNNKGANGVWGWRERGEGATIQPKGEGTYN